MTWLKISDEFLEDDTVLTLKDRAYRLHVSAMVYSSRNLTDGQINLRALKVLQAILGYPLAKFVAELIDSGLWLPAIGGGYQIKNFLEYNPTAAQVKSERKRNAKRQKEWRERHKPDNPADNTSRNAVTNAAPTRPDPRSNKGFTATHPEKPSIESITPDLRGIA